MAQDKTRIKFRNKDISTGFSTEQLIKIEKYMRTQPTWKFGYDKNGWFMITNENKLGKDDISINIIQTDILIMCHGNDLEIKGEY